MISNFSNNKRIAKNTLILYVRMLFMMLVALYTSRVILNVLGVEDFGIYNVVGGLVSMFALVSGAISISISRFITFELGRNNQKELNIVFSSAIIIQIVICLLFILLAETLGLWFLNTKMSFPEGRMCATNVIFQFSVATFCVNLISIPYNAAIIAHEKMAAFAYISIFETLAKLIIAFAIPYILYDKLIIYGGLLLLVAIIVRLVYGIYCKYHFEECRFRFLFDKTVFYNMFTYAGWTYIGASSALLRDTGGNILINLFYGPVANAANGIGTQVQQAVNQFVTNFMTVLNPQIIKSYAAANYDYMKFLVLNASRISYYMMLVFSLPILFNTHYILVLWLKQVPQYCVEFVRLALLFVMSESLSTPLITSASASGKIKKYQLLVGGIQSFNFPLSLLCLYMGMPPYVTFVVAICISQLCLAGRLYILRNMMDFSARQFIHSVYSNIIKVTIIALILPIGVQYYIDESWGGFIISCIICFISVFISIVYVGCNRQERAFIMTKAESFIHNFF